MTIIEPIHDWEDFRTELDIGWSKFFTTQWGLPLDLDPALYLISHYCEHFSL